MGKRSPQSIESYLQRKDVQERIRNSILRNHSDLTVPISGAVNLLGFGVNQLRKWEEKGLLNPIREGKHRQYSLHDLDKLAVIKELVAAKFSPSTIPPDIDIIWNSISPSEEQLNWVAQGSLNETIGRETESKYLYINQRIEGARKELFWRYYASFVVRISLQLIREDMPNQGRSAVGLVLPLNADATTISALTSIDDLSNVGKSLVGWLAQSGSSHTLFTTTPSFQHLGHYRIYRLGEIGRSTLPERDMPIDHTLLLVGWQENAFSLSGLVVNTIRHLFTPLIEEAEFTRICFDKGMRDALDPGTDLDSNFPDYILNGLADMVIRLGNIGGERWRFCCILLPDDTTIPLQQRSLVVRAQSENAPHKIGKSQVSPDEPTLSISLRAYQSGQTIYRSEICKEDLAIAFRELEEPGSGSVIALPTGGKGRAPAAILYVVADQPDAFSLDNQRILRLIGTSIEELLEIYRARQVTKESLSNAITSPEYVDTFFEKRKILSENNFVMDIEAVLRDIQSRAVKGVKVMFAEDNVKQNLQQKEALPGEGISFISIDIDEQSKLASRFGDQFTRNLSKVVGSYLNDQLRRILTDVIDYRLYHIWTDRFYLVIKGLELEEVRKHAERIRRKLKDSYEVSVILPWFEESINPRLENKQEVSISVRVGVTHYPYSKLEDLLERYTATTYAVGNVRALISRDIDKALDKGRLAGGDVVISWNPNIDKEKQGFIRLYPTVTT
jgi:DNA-binding transcriptional MerR regulator/GGDEF domain-containing protein